MTFKFPEKLPKKWFGKVRGTSGNKGIQADPDFGFKPGWLSAADNIGNHIAGTYYTCPERGTADSITAALKPAYPGQSGRVKCALYREVDNTLVGVTEEKIVTLEKTEGYYWVTFNFTEPKPLLENESYCLVAWSDTNFSFGLAPLEGVTRARLDITYNNYPDPWAPIRVETNEGNAIYCTYTPAPGHFGNPVKGGTGTTTADIAGSWYSCPQMGKADTISVYIEHGVGQTVTGKVKCAIYKRSDGSLVGYTEEGEIPPDWVGWKTLRIISGGMLEPADYYLVFWQSPGGGPHDPFMFLDSEELKGGRQTRAYNAFPDPWTPSWTNEKFSIYCTYTTLVRLEINSSPVTGVPFTVDGASATTPFSTNIEMGTYTITMPETVTVNGTTYAFAGWADGVAERVRTINITSDTSLTANYTPTVTEHKVTVESTPVAGVSVIVDGVTVGNTPVSTSVTEGNHTIEVPNEVEM